MGIIGPRGDTIGPMVTGMTGPRVETIGPVKTGALTGPPGDTIGPTADGRKGWAVASAGTRLVPATIMPTNTNIRMLQIPTRETAAPLAARRLVRMQI